MALQMSPAIAIDPQILDEAADWLLQLHDGAVKESDRIACERWRQRSPEHARAWARAELLMNKLGGLPSGLAMPALRRPANVGRRAAVVKLALLLAAVPASWGAWRFIDEQEWTADYRTAVGERCDLRLADGTRLALNTATAIDVHFDEKRRTISLREGEILVETAPDIAAKHRPFSVNSIQGNMEALGTRFSVRQRDGLTQIAVLEGAVRITPEDGKSMKQVLQAGQQTTFTKRNVQAPSDADDSVVAWMQDMLMADKMRMGDFAAELSRYRRGIVRVDPALTNLPISGAFPVGDTDQTLAMLVSTYPVDAVTRLGGRWITLVPR